MAEVDPAGPAAEAGIQPGDVILEVNRQPVRSPAEIKTALQKSGSRAVLLLVARDGKTLFLAVQPRKNPIPGSATQKLAFRTEKPKQACLVRHLGFCQGVALSVQVSPDTQPVGHASSRASLGELDSCAPISGTSAKMPQPVKPKSPTSADQGQCKIKCRSEGCLDSLWRVACQSSQSRRFGANSANRANYRVNNLR